NWPSCRRLSPYSSCKFSDSRRIAATSLLMVACSALSLAHLASNAVLAVIGGQLLQFDDETLDAVLVDHAAAFPMIRSMLWLYASSSRRFSSLSRPSSATTFRFSTSSALGPIG